MRKHSVRKWLHAILDLLPLFVIPIFAIYSRNENAQFGYEVTQEVNKVVDFNQQLNIRNFTQSFNGIDYVVNQGHVTANGTSTARSNLQLYTTRPSIIDSTHKCLLKGISGGTDSTQYISIVYYYNNSYVTYSTFKNETIFYMPNNVDSFQLECVGAQVSGITLNDYVFVPQIFDLTQMFGVGNEPTIQEFNNLFPNSYYPYTESQELVIENYETITYNDTDIGSQMVYTLYNTVDKYFNMNNVFNMGAIWNWVNNTMFGGSAPLSAYIVYQIIAYELIMDIIFLLYSVMMFIVDFAEKGIDRFMGRTC